MRVRISSGTCHPLPIEIIAGDIAVDELRHEIARAASPVLMQIFDQKGGGDHSHSVVH